MYKKKQSAVDNSIYRVSGIFLWHYPENYPENKSEAVSVTVFKSEQEARAEFNKLTGSFRGCGGKNNKRRDYKPVMRHYYTMIIYL